MPRTDLESHHIERYAAVVQTGDAHFDVPLISRIQGNLWMGGCINKVRLDESFAHVISLYPWERYALGPNTVRLEQRMSDSYDMPKICQIETLAAYVSACLDEGKTLVHCQAGLNRSGLISALTLIRRGWDPPVAIMFLRYRRHALVLCNETFEAWLLNDAVPS